MTKNEIRAVKDYINYLEIKNYSTMTIKNYINSIYHFRKHIGKSLLEVNKSDFTKYIIKQMKKEVEGKSILQRLYALKKFYKYMSNHGYIREQIHQKIPYPNRFNNNKLVHFLTPEQIKKLLVIPDINDPFEFRDKVAMEIMYSALD